MFKLIDSQAFMRSLSAEHFGKRQGDQRGGGRQQSLQTFCYFRAVGPAGGAAAVGLGFRCLVGCGPRNGPPSDFGVDHFYPVGKWLLTMDHEYKAI